MYQTFKIGPNCCPNSWGLVSCLIHVYFPRVRRPFRCSEDRSTPYATKERSSRRGVQQVQIQQRACALSKKQSKAVAELARQLQRFFGGPPNARLHWQILIRPPPTCPSFLKRSVQNHGQNKSKTSC